MKINKKQLRKLILEKVFFLNEEDLKSVPPMQNMSVTDETLLKEPGVLLEQLNDIKESLGIIWDNQQMIFEKITTLEGKNKNET